MAVIKPWQRQKGLNTKIHLAVDAHGMPVRIIVTEGTRADCKEAIHLIKGIDAEALLADRGYDTDEIISYALDVGMEPVIPPKRNRKELREYDKYLYRMRHLVENAFLALKQWRGIATRYAKTLDAFVAAIQVRCIVIWLSYRRIFPHFTPDVRLSPHPAFHRLFSQAFNQSPNEILLFYCGQTSPLTQTVHF